MAIFICKLKKLNLGMDAGICKDRKGLFLGLETSVPFFLF